ncbi:MAG: Uma2 family endonuclease [Caldilineaceae bacterium]|nr:Uma2 family endonuclease [Caldilineaceae bacterium]
MIHSETATPVWRIATLFPYQGAWSEQEYLALDTNRRVEFDNGFVEVHDVPTDQHQAIILFLSLALSGIAQQIGGAVRTAGMRLRLWDQKYREPDIVVLRDRNSQLRQKTYWDGADLAIEIVSESLEDRERDLVTKRLEYARSGIEEYWIVDPEQETVTVLNLWEDVYMEGAVFVRGDTVTSSQLPEFALPVSEILDADRSF